MVVGKVANCRTVLLRAMRDHEKTVDAAKLDGATWRLARTLRRVAEPLPPGEVRGCEGEAAHTYFGAFDHLGDPAHWATLQHRLEAQIKLEEDSLRYYFLAKNWKNRIEHGGAKPAYDPQGPLIA